MGENIKVKISVFDTFALTYNLTKRTGIMHLAENTSLVNPDEGLLRQRKERIREKEQWYVIYTRSRQEKNLSEKLSQAGFKTYVPLVKRVKQWSDRVKSTEQPLFNSYIFIKGVWDKQELKDYKGVVKIVSFENGPAKVSQEEIETLKSIIQHGYDVMEITDYKHLLTGCRVIIDGGPLKGKTGELLDCTGDYWFLICFDNFHNSIKVKVPSQYLKKI